MIYPLHLLDNLVPGGLKDNFRPVEDRQARSRGCLGEHFKSAPIFVRIGAGVDDPWDALEGEPVLHRVPERDRPPHKLGVKFRIEHDAVGKDRHGRLAILGRDLNYAAIGNRTKEEAPW